MPLDRSHRRLTAEQRAESARARIKNWAAINPETACWDWTGSVTWAGYGRLQMPDGTGRSTARGAHRVSYEVFVGPIAEGLQIDHLCSNRRCVNPAHLQAVTGADNVWRSPRTAAFRNGTKTHCAPAGHEFTPENTYTDPKTGYRQCKACKAELMRGYRARRKASAAIGAALSGL